MAMQRPTLAVIRDRVMADIESNISQTTPILRKAVLRVLGYVFAGLAHMLYGYIDSLAIDLFPDTCRSAWLDRWASIWGISRKSAGYASGPAIITGTSGLTVPAETAIIGTNQIEYLTTAECTLVDGTATVTVAAETAGEDGNIDSGTMTLVNPITGIDSTVTIGSVGITGGTDAETDNDLRERVLLRIQTPPQGGAASDYKLWALDVSGVTRVWVTPLYKGAGTVGVTFVTDNASTGIIPSAEKVAEVAAYIETVRPIGATVYVYAPTETPTPMTISIYPNTAAVQAAVLAELKELFAEKGGPGGTVYFSQMDAAISNASGEEHHAIISPTDDLIAGTDHILTVGTITWQPYS